MVKPQNFYKCEGILRNFLWGRDLFAYFDTFYKRMHRLCPLAWDTSWNCYL